MKVSKKLLNFIADSLESYIDVREELLISEISPEELEKQLKKGRKLVKKIRKGDMSVFNEEVLEDELPALEDLMRRNQNSL
jgi:hypothetical protein